MNKAFIENVQKAMQITEKKKVEKLHSTYESIPSGKCVSGCAKCCMESVETHYIEFLQIYTYLREDPVLWKKLLPKILYFYFYELKEKMPCPFLNENNQCSIYEVRPLPCRLYGHLDEKDYEESYLRVKKQGEEAAAYLKKEYDVNIEQEVLGYKVPYCYDFSIVGEHRVSKDQMQEYADIFINVEFQYFMEGLIDLEHISYSLVGWFVMLLLKEDEMNEYRIQVMREWEEAKQKDIFNKILNTYQDVKLSDKR